MRTGSDPAGSALPDNLPEGLKGAQLQEILEAYVAGLEPGSPLPSEREMAQRFGIARMTVRGQLERLVHRGLVYRQPGRGTFVAERMLSHTDHLTSFTEDMHVRGLTPGARLVEAGLIQADRALAARMEISRGSQVARIRRVRTADTAPMAVEVTHLPARRFPGLIDQDLTTQGLYELLVNSYGVQIRQGVHRVTVLTLEPADAALLEVSPGQPAFRIERTTRDADGVVIEYASSIYRGDRYELIIHARREPPH
jgi:GntR family transcriptional regulator